MRSPSSPEFRRHADEFGTYLAHLDIDDPGAALKRLIDADFACLPLPGHGHTIDRWRVLAAVGARDLSLAKLFEGHTDALAILAEAQAQAQSSAATATAARPVPGSIWATWCAEPPEARLLASARPDGSVALSGRKAWCSGAHAVSHAVVSCWNQDGQAVLAAVELRQAGVSITDNGWNAVGMRATASVDIDFDGVIATPLGGPGFYVARAGFWHGGAGVAACWFGAATRLAATLGARVAARPDPHRLAQLGAITVALQSCAALMRETAAAIDRAPHASAMLGALSVRLSVEAAATQTLELAGRALGAGPLCKDPHSARLFADLPVYLRQSHAERDQEAVGTLAAASESAPWTL